MTKITDVSELVAGTGCSFSGDVFRQLSGPQVYMFIEKGRPVYVGMSSNGLARAACGNHKQANLARQECDEVRVWPCKDVESARILERLMIGKIRPYYNHALRYSAIAERLGYTATHLPDLYRQAESNARNPKEPPIQGVQPDSSGNDTSGVEAWEVVEFASKIATYDALSEATGKSLEHRDYTALLPHKPGYIDGFARTERQSDEDMTVGELRQHLKDLPDDSRVGFRIARHARRFHPIKAAHAKVLKRTSDGEVIEHITRAEPGDERVVLLTDYDTPTIPDRKVKHA